MHQALYRKYRPQTFDSVSGEDHITSVLKYESQVGRFSHAYLFCGPRGTGKTSCAKILAKAINCLNPVDGNPCGHCEACRSIDEGNAPDVLEMDAASNNGVDYIRDIRDAVNFTPAALKKRVYIIDEVHMLSSGAFNALLKTLEEPPEHVVFILATTEFHKLPATIISRCQRFDFRRIKTDVLAARLLYIAKEESMVLDEDAAKIIAKQAQGGMRDAISLFELCAAGNHDVTPEQVREVLGLTDIEILYKTAVAVARNDTASLFSVISTIDSSSKDITVYWSELLGFWRDMLVLKNLREEDYGNYFDYTEPEMKLLFDATRRFSQEKLSYHFSLLDDALKEMTRLPQTKRLSAELTLIKMSDAHLDASSDALLARIASLEEKLALLESSPVTSAPSRAEPAPEMVPDLTKAKEGSSSEEDTQSPVSPVTSPSAEAKDPADGMLPVPDFGEIIDRFTAQNPQAAAFLHDSDCFVSPDKKTVLVRTVTDFAKMMLSTSANQQALLSMFRVANITDTGAILKIETGAVPKESKAIDELEEF